MAQESFNVIDWKGVRNRVERENDMTNSITPRADHVYIWGDVRQRRQRWTTHWATNGRGRGLRQGEAVPSRDREGY